jgi:hypothetical protein
MNRLVSLFILMAAMFGAHTASAAQDPNCLTTDPDQIHWTLPKIPSGPSWTLSDSAYNQAVERVAFTATFWRHPCSSSNSQVIMTLDFPQNIVILGKLILVQNGNSYNVSRLLVDIESAPWISYHEYMMFFPLENPPISGIVIPDDTDADFDPNQAFDVKSQGNYGLADPTITRTLHVPAYDPREYGYSGSTPGFKIGPNVTGDWYNSGQSGHGFDLKVLPGNHMLMEWYVFSPEGGPLWLLADGSFSGNTATLNAYTTNGPGGRFPPLFDASQVYRQAWGTVTFTFSDCMTGTVSWQPTAAGFSSGSMPIQHLTIPTGLSCP